MPLFQRETTNIALLVVSIVLIPLSLGLWIVLASEFDFSDEFAIGGIMSILATLFALIAVSLAPIIERKRFCHWLMPTTIVTIGIVSTIIAVVFVDNRDYTRAAIFGPAGVFLLLTGFATGAVSLGRALRRSSKARLRLPIGLFAIVLSLPIMIVAGLSELEKTEIFAYSFVLGPVLLAHGIALVSVSKRRDPLPE